jgi:tartrate dehydratase beta subunit/fumarate hydratase class I family protein
MLSAGVSAVIGKGELHGRSWTASGRRARDFAAVGGLARLLGKRVSLPMSSRFPNPPEAIFRFEVERFPSVLIIDAVGVNYHDTARNAWRA